MQIQSPQGRSPVNFQGECGLSPDLDVGEAGVQVCCACVCIIIYSRTPLNWHPSTADTHYITDNSESPDRPYIHFDT